MLYQDELQEYSKLVKAAVDELLLAARTNQTHPGDLLLIFNFVSTDRKGSTGLYSGYDHIVHAANEQAKFIGEVRKALVIEDKQKLESLEASTELAGIEDLSIHAELLLYLKFWESDMYQRLLYQLAQLSDSKSYDWSFKVDGSVRKLMSKIQTILGVKSPLMSSLLSDSYQPWIRNAIAHSQYYFGDRHLVILDARGDDQAVLSFDDWRKIITQTLLLHNALQMLGDRVLTEYREISKLTNGIIEVRVIRPDNTEEIATLSPMRDRKYWVWTPNLLLSGFQPEP
jgi:hypothetical protein